jgi:hypothetical protein
MSAHSGTVSPKENLYGVDLQSVCYRDTHDKQRKNCVDREEISEGERIDGRGPCVVRPLKHREFSGSMSTGTGFLLKKGSGPSLGTLDIFVDSYGFGDTERSVRFKHYDDVVRNI